MSSAFWRHSSVSTFLLSPRLGSDRIGLAWLAKSAFRLGISLMDHGDAALCRHRHPLAPLSPSAVAADAAGGRYCCRLQLLLTAPLTSASVDRHHRRHRRPLQPSLLAISAATRYCHRPLPLRPTPSAATTASSGLCHRCLQLLRPSNTAAAAAAFGHSCRRPPWSTRVLCGYLGW